MRVLLLLGIIFLAPITVGAQANDFIDTVIGSPVITTEEAAYLILVASENLGDDADAPRAYEMLEQLRWVPKGMDGKSKVKYDQFCYMLMQAFGVRGGILYSAFKNPRYAYRELKNQQVVQGSSDPDMPVSGVKAMKMISRIFDVKGVR